MLPRKQALPHPWQKGFPNNSRLRVLKEAAELRLETAAKIPLATAAGSGHSDRTKR
jgi:hypothetical protein